MTIVKSKALHRAWNSPPSLHRSFPAFFIPPPSQPSSPATLVLTVCATASSMKDASSQGLERLGEKSDGDIMASREGEQEKRFCIKGAWTAHGTLGMMYGTLEW